MGHYILPATNDPFVHEQIAGVPSGTMAAYQAYRHAKDSLRKLEARIAHAEDEGVRDLGVTTETAIESRKHLERATRDSEIAIMERVVLFGFGCKVTTELRNAPWYRDNDLGLEDRIFGAIGSTGDPERVAQVLAWQDITLPPAVRVDMLEGLYWS